MGQLQSSRRLLFEEIDNEFEMVIRASKELEFVLEEEFGSKSKGLHGKITEARRFLTSKLVRDMRYLATIRNRMVHEQGYDDLPSKEKFVATFESSAEELARIIQRRRSGRGRRSETFDDDDDDGSVVGFGCEACWIS